MVGGGSASFARRAIGFFSFLFFFFCKEKGRRRSFSLSPFGCKIIETTFQPRTLFFFFSPFFFFKRLPSRERMPGSFFFFSSSGWAQRTCWGKGVSFSSSPSCGGGCISLFPGVIYRASFDWVFFSFPRRPKATSLLFPPPKRI